MLLLADKWKDYELIDMGNGEKLERWGDIVLRRPDPQVMWPIPNESGLWKNPHGHYHRSNRGGGQWEHKKKYPERWTISYKNLKFNISPTGFKHTGLFPEQAANWDWAMDKIENAKRPIKVLNLFAYTGGATVACAAAGAQMVLFTTGRGTPFASPVPTVKIATNSRLAGNKSNWIDFNAGRIVTDDLPLEDAAKELFQLVLDVASGKKVKAEIAGFHDLAIFKQGVTL